MGTRRRPPFQPDPGLPPGRAPVSWAPGTCGSSPGRAHPRALAVQPGPATGPQRSSGGPNRRSAGGVRDGVCPGSLAVPPCFAGPTERDPGQQIPWDRDRCASMPLAANPCGGTTRVRPPKRERPALGAGRSLLWRSTQGFFSSLRGRRMAAQGHLTGWCRGSGAARVDGSSAHQRWAVGITPSWASLGANSCGMTMSALSRIRVFSLAM